MNKAMKNALGGMSVALIFVMLLPSTFGPLVYVMPILAGLFMVFLVLELGRKLTAAIYVSSAILSILILPNKAAAVMYAAFFGYYAIFKSYLESKRLPRALEIFIKLVAFNVSMIVFGVVMMKLFGMSYDDLIGIDDIKNAFIVKYALPITLLLGNLAFFLLDNTITRFVTLYLNCWQKKVRKILKIK